MKSSRRSKAHRTPIAWLDYRWPVIVRYAGLVLAGYEVIGDDFEHPSALVLAGGMMGLKEVLDSRDRRKDDSP